MKLIFMDKENEDFIFTGGFWLRKIRCFFLSFLKISSLLNLKDSNKMIIYQYSGHSL